MTTQTEVLKLALEALETCYAGDYSTGHVIDPSFDEDAVKEAIIAIKEALVQEKALQALHDENERLGLYKDAYAQPESEPARLQCVTCGTVYADGVPPQVAQPEQEPVAWLDKYGEIYKDVPEVLSTDVPLYTTPPQRTWVGLTDEEHMILYTKADSGLHDWARAIEAKLKEKNT